MGSIDRNVELFEHGAAALVFDLTNLGAGGIHRFASELGVAITSGDEREVGALGYVGCKGGRQTRAADGESGRHAEGGAAG